MGDTPGRVLPQKEKGARIASALFIRWVSGSGRVIPQRSAKLRPMKLAACDRLGPTDHRLSLRVVSAGGCCIAGVIPHARHGAPTVGRLVVLRGVQPFCGAAFSGCPAAVVSDLFACGLALAWLPASGASSLWLLAALYPSAPYLPCARICLWGHCLNRRRLSRLQASCGCANGSAWVYPRRFPGVRLKQAGNSVCLGRLSGTSALTSVPPQRVCSKFAESRACTRRSTSSRVLFHQRGTQIMIALPVAEPARPVRPMPVHIVFGIGTAHQSYRHGLTDGTSRPRLPQHQKQQGSADRHCGTRRGVLVRWLWSRSRGLVRRHRRIFFNGLPRYPHPLARLQKMMALVHLSPSASINARRTLRFSVASRVLREGLNISTPCLIFSLGWRRLTRDFERAGADREGVV